MTIEPDSEAMAEAWRLVGRRIAHHVSQACEDRARPMLGKMADRLASARYLKVFELVEQLQKGEVFTWLEAVHLAEHRTGDQALSLVTCQRYEDWLREWWSAAQHAMQKR